MNTDLDIAFRVETSRRGLERRVGRLQEELLRRETEHVRDIDLTANLEDRTVVIHLLVTADSEADTLTKALGVVVPAIYAIGDGVDFGQAAGTASGPRRRHDVWRPDGELAVASG